MAKKQDLVKEVNDEKIIKKNRLNTGITDTVPKYCVDKIDWDLINILVHNGRMSNIEIADKLKTSEATVRRRIDNLIQAGIVRGFAVLLDYKRLGSSCKAIMQMKVPSASLDKMARFLMKSGQSCGIYRTIGRYNIYTEAIFNSIQEFQNYADLISEMDYVEEFNYLIVTRTYKPCPWTGF